MLSIADGNSFKLQDFLHKIILPQAADCVDICVTVEEHLIYDSLDFNENLTKSFRSLDIKSGAKMTVSCQSSQQEKQFIVLINALDDQTLSSEYELNDYRANQDRCLIDDEHGVTGLQRKIKKY